MSWNPETQKICFFTIPLFDGVGDYSSTKKIVDKLISMGILPQHITLVIVFNDVYIRTYKKMYNEYVRCTNVGKRYEIEEEPQNSLDFPINDDELSKYMYDKDKIIKDDSNFTITKEIIEGLEQILHHFCRKSKEILDETKCEIFKSREETHLEEEYHKDFLKQLNDTLNTWKSLKEEERDDWKVKNSKCTIRGSTLNNFVRYGFNKDFWQTFFKGVNEFLLPFKDVKINVKFVAKEDLSKKSKIDLNCNYPLILLVYIPIQIPNFHDSFGSDNVIFLGEGGYCKKGYKYSSGFGYEKCLGITIVDVSKLDEKLTDGDYNFCYFGKVNENPDHITPYGLLMMYKLRYLMSLPDCKQRIMINKPCFDLILKYKKEFNTIFDDPKIYRFSQNTLMINGKRVEYYGRLSSQNFLNNLNQSSIYSILTCDQSYFEGISLGKIIFYDLHLHKKELCLQIISMYEKFQRIEKKSPDISWMNELFSNNRTNSVYDVKKNSFVVREVGGKSFSYKNLEELYNRMKEASNFLKDPEQKTAFLNWLREHHDFDKNFEKLIQENATSQFKSKSKKSKSKKFKSKKSKSKKFKSKKSKSKKFKK